MSTEKESLYQQVERLGLEMESHESDLHLKCTGESAALIAGYRHRANVRTFTSSIDGRSWYDIPFAFDPFWEARGMI